MFPANIDVSVSKRAALTDKVVVAVKAEKVISKAALAWALTHVVRTGDFITLLAVFEKSGRRFWNFPRLSGDCAGSHRERLPDRICEISESCSQMLLQFHNQLQVGVRIKVVSGASGMAVVSEAKGSEANWVVVDKKLKQELRHCMEELRCNIVVMKGSQAKVLRLNLGCSDEIQTPYLSAASSPEMDSRKGHRMKHSTPVSSPEEPSTSDSRTRDSSSPIYDSTMPLLLIYKENPLFEGLDRGKYAQADSRDNRLTAFYSDTERLIDLPTTEMSNASGDYKRVFWIPQNHNDVKKNPLAERRRNTCRNRTSRTLRDKFVQYDRDSGAGSLELKQIHQKGHNGISSTRNVVPLGRTSSIPPPLCSFCQHKAPAFGKPPRQFSFEELEEATEGFSDMNFLAEGGFGFVYRGKLRDGQVVAVKVLKIGGSEADADFCREVKVLSCAQHRNVVLLIGFCIDDKNRILVYEYVCNGSLDSYLHGNERAPLDWHSRMKIAIGTARGLRYLHEDCRVGCIVHRDMRPNNILLTHDFEPLVADFGLARWCCDWNISTEERLIGTSGYLAPEYIDGGQITQKVDIFAFGMVLLELMSGRRTSELQFHKGQHVLSNWLYPVNTLEPSHILTNISQLLDPRLASEPCHEFAYQLLAMGQAATLCLRQDPELRPPMSKVLRILEGGNLLVPLSWDTNSVGSRSDHFHGVSSHAVNNEMKRSHSRKLSH